MTVTITCDTPEVDIYYTLNGKDPLTLPDNQQIEYKGPITLTETTTIMARAYSGNGWSAIAEVTFTKQTGPKVTWDAATKTGTFVMPGSNVELQVEYYPESNLFLGKEALKDKANISVLNGETAVAFDDAGKSTTTVTEGNTVTAKFSGKKVLGMKVVKKGGGEPVLLTTITAADNSSFKSGSQTFGDVATVTLTGDYLKNDGSHGGWYCQGSNLTATISVAEANGANITSVKFYTAGGGSAEDKEAPFEVTTTTVTSSNITTYLNGNSIGSYGVSKIEVYGTK